MKRAAALPRPEELLERYRAQKEHCHRLLAEWIDTTGDHFPLPDIALHERGTPAEQYRQQLAARGREPPAGP